MSAQYRWDDFLLDLDAYRLERAGAPVSLEPKAFNLLVLMVRRPGHLFTKQEIFEAVWPDTSVTDHALTRVVAQLRRVLGDEAREATYLETVPTRGYRWIRPVEEVVREPGLTASPHTAAEPPVPPAAPARARAPRAVAAALLLASLAVAGVLWVRHGSSTSVTARPSSGDGASGATSLHDVQWPVQLTTHAGLDLHPAFSPQGDAIAFASDRTGAFEIHVRALGGTGSDSRLTSDGGQNAQPAWSPDGRFLAYHSYRHGGIWVVPARGGTPKQLAVIGSNPDWSPDSLRIAFQSDEHADASPTGYGAQSGSTIWVVDADGSDPDALTRSGSPMGGHAAPAWSPDGRHLAFTVFDARSENGIWVLNLDTSETRPLAQGSGYFESAFAPDNKALYVAGGDALIVRLPFDPATGASLGPRQVIPVPGVPGVRGLTIDGRRIGFAGVALSSQIWAQPVTRDGSPNGASIALTSDTSRRNTGPAISPDGSRVAYMSTRRGEPPNVWMMDIDGRNAIQLTPDETSDYHASWLRDGRRVAYLSNRGETQGIWAVDVTTRREELILDFARARRPASAAGLTGKLAELELSPSMMRAAFSLLTPPAGLRALYVAEVEPFAPRRLTDGTRSIGYPTWSPDERRLAVEIKDGSDTHAGVLDVQTGALRQLTHERGHTWVRSWSPDGRRIAVAVLRDGLWSLQWIEVDGARHGVMTPAGPPGVYVRYPEWSPLGNTVLFERAEMRGNIWMLTLR